MMFGFIIVDGVWHTDRKIVAAVELVFILLCF
jgi:hypothetical protein